MAQQEQEKQWKIVRIVDHYRVIINGGRKDNIKKNDRFDIVGTGLEIKDPETGKILDILNRSKATVAAIHLEDNIAVLENILTTTKAEYPMSAYGLFDKVQPITKTYIKELNVENDSIEGGWDTEPIKLGDTVIRHKDV